MKEKIVFTYNQKKVIDVLNARKDVTLQQLKKLTKLGQSTIVTCLNRLDSFYLIKREVIDRKAYFNAKEYILLEFNDKTGQFYYTKTYEDA